MVDADHPYFINSGDNPGTLLVATILAGAVDYFSWARSMRRALMTKNKAGFVDGTELPPDASDPLYPAWQRANGLVLGWLNRAVSPDIAQSVLWLDSARDVWLDLEERFRRSSGALSVSSYYTRFKVYWDEYTMFRPVPCSCDALVRVRDYFRTEQIIRFLRGLNPGFSAVRSQILRSDPLPTINNVFAMVAQEEQEIGGGAAAGVHQDDGVPNLGSTHVLAAGSSNAGANSQFKRGTKRPLCSYCGLIGHTIEKCYRKNGYPPGYRNKGKALMAVHNSSPGASAVDVAGTLPEGESGGVTISQQQYQALYSLFQGHGSAASALGPAPGSVVSCVSKNPDAGSVAPMPNAQYVPSSSQGPAQSEDAPSNSQGMILPSFSHQNHSITSWVVDSGASDHIVCSASLLYRCQPVSNLSVTLPDGKRVPVSYTGSVKLTDTLLIHDILVIPSFAFNLLSVSKLTFSVELCSHLSLVFFRTKLLLGRLV
ncbi:hypothetical protein LINPERHAP1_LOCUS20967 [Linum perenne]